MTCKTLVLSAMALSLAFSETSRALDLRTGRYTVGDRIRAFISDTQKDIDTPTLRITRNGSNVEIFDLENKITYHLDLSNPGEQAFPQEYFDLQKNEKSMGALMNTVKSIKVENVKETDDKITANINVYMETKNSVFGNTRAKIVMSAELANAKCEFRMEKSTSQGFTESKSDIPCLKLHVADNIELGSLALDLPGVKAASAWVPLLTNTAGVVLDLVLKSCGFGIKTNLIRIPRF